MWLTPDAIATWAAAGVGKRGGQLQYSDAAIETALTLRLILHLPLRQTEGFLTSLFGMLGVALSAPDHTTLSRRGQRLDLSLRRVPLDDRIHLIVDSTGLSIAGEGEWAAGCFCHQVLLRRYRHWDDSGSCRPVRVGEHQRVALRRDRSLRGREDVPDGQPPRGESSLHRWRPGLASELQRSMRSDEVVVAAQ